MWRVEYQHSNGDWFKACTMDSFMHAVYNAKWLVAYHGDSATRIVRVPAVGAVEGE